jgi:predicted metal-dependent hydrolase
MTDATEYDPRYLAGLDLFNRREFFEAHEVWEELWHETPGPDRRFYQGLIQAAVAVYHAGNGNGRGARRLFHSGRKYMSAYPSQHLGLDIPTFWTAMERALADFLSEAPADSATLRADLLPTIQLDPRPR